VQDSQKYIIIKHEEAWKERKLPLFLQSF